MSPYLADDDQELSEINVTPFIDVMLVLLIVFMVAAPLSTVDVQVNLPSSTAPPTERPKDPIWLTLTADLSVLLEEAPVLAVDLAKTLDQRSAEQRDTQVFLRADQSVDYGALMQLLDQLRAAGYLKVALVGLEGAP